MTRFYSAKADANQQEIIDQVREIPGLSVVPIHRHGDGVPDLLIGYKRHTLVMEVKNPENISGPPMKHLTKDEKKFLDNWTGSYAVGYTSDPIIEWVNMINTGSLENSPQPIEEPTFFLIVP